MENAVTERKEHIDILKGIGIISVVIGHALNTEVFPSNICDSIRKFVYIYHLPVFFICSGYLFNNKGFISLFHSIKKKYKKFVIINFLSFLLFPLWVFLDILEPFNSYGLLSKMYRIILFRTSGIFVQAMWFIPFLCITQIMFYYIIKIPSQTYKYIIILFCMLIGTFLTKHGYLHYYNINISLLMIPIMFLGKFLPYILLYKKWEITTICFASGLSVLICNHISGYEIDLSKAIIYGNYLFYPIVIVGIVFCLSLTICLIKYNNIIILFIKKICTICGQYSLYIMAYHFIIFKIIDGCIHKFITNENVLNCRLWPIGYPEIRPIYIILGIALPIFFVKTYKNLKINIFL